VSKTSRELPEPPVQLDEEEKHSENIVMKPSDIQIDSTSTARRRRQHKNLQDPNKPISARSNNLELWLSKKKALDQQSQSNKQSKSSRRGKRPPADGVDPGPFTGGNS
jgi:hypothetical protein